MLGGVGWVEDDEWSALARELSFSGCRRVSRYPFRWSFDRLKRSVEITHRPPTSVADALYGVRDGHETFVITVPDHTLVVVPIEPPLGLELEIQRKTFVHRAEELVDDVVQRFKETKVWWGVSGFAVEGPPADRSAELFSGGEGIALRGRIERSIELLRIHDDAVFSGSRGLVTRANDLRHHAKLAAAIAQRLAERRLALAPTEDEVRFRDVWARFAQKHDLTFDAARLRAFGNVARVHLDIRPACTRDAWWTSVDVTTARRSSTAYEITQLLASTTRPPSTYDTITFGHVAFDAQFVVRATDEAVARVALRPPVIDALVAHAQTAVDTIATPGRLSFEVPGRVGTEEELERLAERALSLASALFDVSRVGPYR